ncbi:hypothetical protein ACFR9S_02025, partial [Halolamina salina]
AAQHLSAGTATEVYIYTTDIAAGEGTELRCNVHAPTRGAWGLKRPTLAGLRRSRSPRRR